MPGRSEMRTGYPMVGQAGKLTDACLAAVGWSRDRTYVTNLLCEYKREPTWADAVRCNDRFTAELKALKPRLIVALGALPVQRFFGSAGVKKSLGAVVWSEEFDCWVMATWQPAAAFQPVPGASAVSDLVRDFSKIPYYLPLKRDFSAVPYEVVTSKATAQAVLQRTREWDFPAIDIETKWDEINERYVDDVRCLAVSNGTETYVIPEAILEQLRPEDWPADTQWGTWNGVAFDAPVMKHDLGAVVNVAEDGMLMSHSLDERSGGGDEGREYGDLGVGIHGLKLAARGWQAAGFYEVDTKTKDDALLWEYNAKDAAYTSRIIRMMVPRQIEEGVRENYLNVRMENARVFAAQRPYGIYMSPDKIHALAVDWGERWLRMEEWLVTEAEEHYGWKGKTRFNLNSPAQLKKFLNDYLGVSVPDTKADTLKAFRFGHKWIEEFQSWKRLDKNLNTYVLGLSNHVDENGFIHPEVHVHGTANARVTYHKPALQTMPTGFQYYDPDDAADPRIEAEIREYRQVRGLVSGDPGDLYIEADFAGAELWPAALLSNDDMMLEDLFKGDFHSSAAESMFVIDRRNFEPMQWAQVRRESKYVTFGLLFWRQAKSLKDPGPGQQGELTKFTLKEIEAICRRWHERYDDHYQWVLRNIAQVQKTGELQTPSGWKRRWPAPSLVRNLPSQVANAPVQITCHEHLALAYVEVWKMWERGELPARPLWDGHDAIYYSCPPDRVHDAVQMIRSVMSKPRYFELGLPVDIKVGANWGEATDYKDTHEYSLETPAAKK